MFSLNLKTEKSYDEEFLNKNSRPMMNVLRTTLHENPRALYAFSAKWSSALTKYDVTSNLKHLNTLRSKFTIRWNFNAIFLVLTLRALEQCWTVGWEWSWNNS